MVSLQGEDGDYLGNSIAVVGDVNGDSFEDFVVGAHHAEGDRGQLFLVLGCALE